MKIPLVDLKANYLSIKEEIDLAVAETLDSCQFIGGDAVRNFESEFAEYVGAENCVSCANGTDALELSLQALGVDSGDEVIVPAISWIATSECVTSVNATPVFVDVDPDTLTICPNAVADAVTEKTKAIIPVHLYGCPAPMQRLREIASQHSLLIIEDCAQAHGARFGDQNIGTFGDASTFSFFPGKNLGAFGDAGAVFAKDPQVARRVRMIANHGQTKKNDHRMEGRNSRMDALHAAVLSVKLKHLPRWTAVRIELAKRYQKKLESLPLRLPIVPADCQHVFHLYVVRTNDRDQLQSHLESRGVSVGIHYPKPLPLLDCYCTDDTKKKYPNAARACEQILSIPIYPELTEPQQDYIVRCIADFFG